jgi:hypothetical protein
MCSAGVLCNIAGQWHQPPNFPFLSARSCPVELSSWRRLCSCLAESMFLKFRLALVLCSPSECAPPRTQLESGDERDGEGGGEEEHGCLFVCYLEVIFEICLCSERGFGCLYKYCVTLPTEKTACFCTVNPVRSHLAYARPYFFPLDATR